MSETDSLNLALLLFRAAVGGVFLAHGINHIAGGGKIAGTARWFSSLGMRPPLLHAWVASITEVAAGALLILGFLTPFAGAAVMGVMVVAWVTNHRGNGFFIFRPGEGWEYVMTLTFCGLLLSVIGAGQWALDAALDIFNPPGQKGFAIAAGGGILAPALLLGSCWRPSRKAGGPA